MSSYSYTTQTQVRRAFWREHPQIIPLRKVNTRGKVVELRQNQQPADTRMAFVDFVDQLHRGGDISDALAQRVTL